MLPLPAALFGVVALAWIIVFGVLIAHLDAWTRCKGEGVHFVITTAGLFAGYGMTFLIAAAVAIVGLQGSVFEVSKRRGVVYLLYLQTLVWLMLVAFLIYGTVIVYVMEPTCSRYRRRRQDLKHLVHGMIYSTWGLIIFILALIYLMYNSYQGKDNLQSWEQRINSMSYVLCCREAVTAPTNGRRSAIPSIAQWVSALFANVDLSPTDLTEAFILTAAAQSMRRKMQIKRALQSTAMSGKSFGGSRGSSATMSSASPDDVPSVLSETAATDDSSNDEDTQDSRQEPDSSLTAARSPSKDDVIAVPENYPEEWSSMAKQAYAETAERIKEVQSPPSSHRKRRPSDTEALTPNGRGHEGRRPTSGEARQSTGVESEVVSAFARSSVQSMAGSELQHLPEGSDTDSEASSRKQAGSASSAGGSYVSLSQVDGGMLEEFSAMQSRARGRKPSPKERFGIKGKLKRRQSQETGTRQAEASSVSSKSSSEGDQSQSWWKLGLGRRSSQRPKSSRSRQTGDPNLPSNMAGKLQAGLNEPGGGLPPAHAKNLAHAFTFESSIPQTVPGTSLDVAASELTDEGFGAEGLVRQQEGVDPGSCKLDEHYAAPPILTPSEQVTHTAGSAVPVEQAVEEAVGRWTPAGYEVLDEAANWARFASAVYAVMPFTEQRYKGAFCCQHPVTEESVRDAVVDLANIEAEDLLYFSHSNTALAHLPYMVALDRKEKAIVVAIRGTMSLADLVTDAVVHPESLSSWLPSATRKVKRKAAGGGKKAYAHAGILSAAKAVLEDLEVHGILQTLLQPDRVRRASQDYMALQRKQQRQSLNESRGPRKSFAKDVPPRHVPNMTRKPYEHEFLEDKATGNGNDHGHHQGPSLKRDKSGLQSGGVWPSEDFQPEAEDSSKKTATTSERDEMASAAGHTAGPTQAKGKATGQALQKNLDTKGWRLVLTGHSLGAGAAALIGLKIYDRYPELKVWAFCPPGGLISKGLVGFTESWCTSVVVGKDVVPRMNVNNLSRLMDEMVTSLARCRSHKLRVLFGGWWRKESRPPPDSLFYSYRQIPLECRLTLERYHKSTARKGRAKDMYPPGRTLFVRPLKSLERAERHGEEARLKQSWDVVWISSQDLIREGILVSKKMLAHHSITNALLEALGYAIRHHPDNPKSAEEKREEKKEEDEMKNELEEIRVEEGRGPMDVLTSAPS